MVGPRVGAELGALPCGGLAGLGRGFPLAWALGGGGTEGFIG